MAETSPSSVTVLSASREARASATPLPTSVTRKEVASIVERFTEAWARPTVERLIELLHPEVRLLQPVVRPIVGREAARREFARLLAFLPDLHGTIDRTAIEADVALIAWRLAFTLGGRPYELRIVDRLVVADGLIREREAYYDSLGLMIAVLSRPSSWLGYWRYRGYLPRSIFAQLSRSDTVRLKTGAPGRESGSTLK